jgi:hypothetical protein
MAKTLSNRKLYKYSRFQIPQEMRELCEELRVPKHLVNYYGERGFVFLVISGTDKYRIQHHRWGSIAHPDTHLNEWTGAQLKKYLHESYYYENKSDNPEDEFKRISKEKWFTEKDLQIVMAIYYHRVMTTTQLTAMGIYVGKTADRQIRGRCKKLKDNFILESFQPSVDHFIGSHENHYMLNEVGAHIVASYLKKHVKEIGWTPRHNEIMMHTVYHTIEINNVFMAFRDEAKRITTELLKRNLSMDEFLKQNEEAFQVERTVAEYLISQNVQGAEGNFRFNPDGLLVIKYKGTSLPLFLEVDRNTMDLADFMAKVPRYELYAKSKLWENTIKSMPAVMVCTTDEKRMIELARVVYQKRVIKQIPWLFTTIDKVKESPLGEIWIEATDASGSEFQYHSTLDFF